MVFSRTSKHFLVMEIVFKLDPVLCYKVCNIYLFYKGKILIIPEVFVREVNKYS